MNLIIETTIILVHVGYIITQAMQPGCLALILIIDSCMSSCDLLCVHICHVIIT